MENRTPGLLNYAASGALMTIAALNDFQYKTEDEFYTRPSWENLSENVGKIYTMHGVYEKFEVHLHTLGLSFKSVQRELAFRFLEKHLTG
jgi:hypothetical protein